MIGVPREIKDHEYRVGITPDGVRALRAAGHPVRVEQDAGARVGFGDDQYKAAGAEIVADARGAYAADLIVKVKELQRGEFPLLRPEQVLFCYHHLCACARAPAAAWLRALDANTAAPSHSHAAGDSVP